MFRLAVRSYSSSVRRLAEATNQASGAGFILNFSTPHAAVVVNKTVYRVNLPGEDGEYGVTGGISPLISQLKPGVVSVIHVAGVRLYFYFYFYFYPLDYDWKIY